jgi:hypothetical protein
LLAIAAWKRVDISTTVNANREIFTPVFVVNNISNHISLADKGIGIWVAISNSGVPTDGLDQSSEQVEQDHKLQSTPKRTKRTCATRRKEISSVYHSLSRQILEARVVPIDLDMWMHN